MLGVDGCRAGWVVATRVLASGETRVTIADTFRSILDGAGAQAAAIVVDMPIGLCNVGVRACETQARRLLGARRASVFASPLRPMLALSDYRAANAFGKASGRGLSKQAWMIAPKIREIDAAITPADQRRVFEGHPELAFSRLGGAPCANQKRSQAGGAERRTILAAAGVGDPEGLTAALRTQFPLRRHFAEDDVLDACALALTAEALLTGAAWRLGDGTRDARGLLMEICG